MCIRDSQKPMKNQYFLPRTFPKPPATFPELSGSATELPGASQECFWTGLRTLDSGLHTTGPAGFKTGPRRFPAAQSSQNHHKISSNPIRNTSKTSCNLPRHLWKRHTASWSLSRMFLDSPPDSGLHWTPDSRFRTPDSLLWTPY